MGYYISITKEMSFEEAMAKVKEGLEKEGFGVLTEIDVKATLKKKLNVDFRNYIILGACNPTFAYEALQAEPQIGTMLPCNVTIQEHGPHKVEIAAVDPLASMQAVENPALYDIAVQVQAKLKNVIDRCIPHARPFGFVQVNPRSIFPGHPQNPLTCKSTGVNR